MLHRQSSHHCNNMMNRNPLATRNKISSRKAWEEQSSSPQYDRVVNEPTVNVVHSSKIPRKTVSFSSQLPSYKKTTSLWPLTTIKHAPKKILPELVKMSGASSVEDTDVLTEDNDLHDLTKNGLQRNHVADTHVISTLEQSLLSMKERQRKLQQEHERAMCDMRNRYQLELSGERQRLQSQILTLSGMQQQYDDIDIEPYPTQIQSLEQKLADKTAECYNLQAELNAKKVALESEQSLQKSEATLLRAQVESLQSQLTAKTQEIDQLKSKQINHGRLVSIQKEKQKLMSDFTSTLEHNTSLKQQLATLNKQLTNLRPTNKTILPSINSETESLQKMMKLSQKEVRHLQKSLSDEHKRHAMLQEKLLQTSCDLDDCKKSLDKSEAELEEVKQKKGDGSIQSSELQTRNHMLTADLSAAQDIQLSLEKKIKLLEQSLHNHNSAKKYITDLETDLLKARTALADSEKKLAQMRDKCHSLENSLETTHLNESQMSDLETEVYDAKLKLTRLNNRLETELNNSLELKAKSLKKQLHDELNCTQKECVALQDQLQLQRESAALALNRIQQAGYKKQKKIVRQVKELQKALKQSQTAEKKAKSECLVHMAEQSHENAQLQKLKKTNKDLIDDMEEKKTLLKLSEQQIHELSVRIEEQKELQESLQIKISHEEVGRVKCQTQLNECRGNLEETKIKCERLETSLTQTVEEVEQEKKNCISLQLLVTHTKEQLSACRQTMKQRERDAQTHLKLLKREYQNQMRASTLQLEDLNIIIKHLQEKEKQAVQDLEKVRVSLNTECQELQLRLDSVNRQLAEETHKSQVVSEENSSLRTRLGDLQDKVFKLTLAQTEYEEYTLRVEEATKLEMHQMFEEMTQHIQQQSNSHKYLEKLRVENERMTVQEKERQIEDLKCELTACKQQREQEKVLIESLKFENQLIRTQLRKPTWSSHRRELTFKRGHSQDTNKLPPIHS